MKGSNILLSNVFEPFVGAKSLPSLVLSQKPTCAKPFALAFLVSHRGRCVLEPFASAKALPFLSISCVLNRSLAPSR